jgi:hypothetical protein
MALSMIAVSASTVKSAKVLIIFDQPFINHFYTISLQDGADISNGTCFEHITFWCVFSCSKETIFTIFISASETPWGCDLHREMVNPGEPDKD